MNKSLSIAAKTRNSILRSKKHVWTLNDFKTGNPYAVLKELSRLTHEGSIVRVSKGIYYRPVMTELGPSKLSKEELTHLRLRRKGIVSSATGNAGFNTIGLTTQMSAITELAVSRTMRLTGPEKSKVRLVLRNPASLHNGTERVILDSLRNIMHVSDTTPEQIVFFILNNVSSGKVSIDRLTKLAVKGEPPRVRALIGAIGEQVGASAKTLAPLHDSLNPTTIFHVPIGNTLTNAKRWNIRG